MEGEVEKVMRACLLVPAALAYCYALPSVTSPGKWRLLAVLPVAVLFFVIPFSFSTLHLRFISGLFLTWIATFKLLLFSLGRGPLSPDGLAPLSSLPAFVAAAALPIKIRQKPLPRERGAPPSLLTLLGFAVKGLILALIFSVYPHRRSVPRRVVILLYYLHAYLFLDTLLAATAAMGRALLPAGTELEPQFAAPYLSSSLQNFWGRRWNLMVSDIIRSTVHVPVRAGWGTTAGVVASFLVSGLMHEVLLYYLTMAPPTGMVGCFFALHGVVVAAEIAAKRWWAGRGLRPLHRALSAPLTLGFLLTTANWLFFPQLAKHGMEEAIVSEVEAAMGMLWSAVGGGR